MPTAHDYPFDRRGGGSHLHPLRRPPWPGPLLLRLVTHARGVRAPQHPHQRAPAIRRFSEQRIAESPLLSRCSRTTG